VVLINGSVDDFDDVEGPVLLLSDSVDELKLSLSKFSTREYYLDELRQYGN
jgi:hypothetical protein